MHTRTILLDQQRTPTKTNRSKQEDKTKYPEAQREQNPFLTVKIIVVVLLLLASSTIICRNMLLEYY